MDRIDLADFYHKTRGMRPRTTYHWYLVPTGGVLRVDLPADADGQHYVSSWPRLIGLSARAYASKNGLRASVSYRQPYDHMTIGFFEKES